MSMQLTGIVRSINRNIDEPLNILSGPTHAAVDCNLARTGHNFYYMRHETFVPWKLNQKPLPKNCILFDNIMPDMEFDLIIGQNIFSQMQIFRQIQQQYQVPLIRLEHTTTMDTVWSDKKIKALGVDLQGDVNVFITDYSRRAWGFDETNSLVIRHGIDLKEFDGGWTGQDKRILTIANDYANRDYFLGFQLYKAITQQLPVNPVGDTPGFSKPTTSFEELKNHYKNSAVFLNTSLRSPIPHSLLEAAAMGMPIVSTNNCAISELIEHNVNGLLTNDPNEMRQYLVQLLQNPDLGKKLGQAARKTIKEKFTISKFVERWNAVFSQLVGTQHG